MELVSPPAPGSVLIPVKLQEVLIHCLGLTVCVEVLPGFVQENLK